jgi:hypothetical protein
MKTTYLLTLAFAALAATSCEKSETVAAVETTAPADPAFEAYFTDEALADAMPIHVARTSASPGDEIVLSGRIMGREKVFVDGRASFVLGDPAKLTPCNEMPDDNCTTPWDACCDTKELKRVGLASIQILGEDGRVLSGVLKGTKGLKELSTLTVSGTVDKSSTEENLVINATKIYVEKP